MARVTSKRQVTIPKAIADQYRIEPGDEVQFEPAGSAIRVRRESGRGSAPDRERRRELFDRATQRQHDREQTMSFATGEERDWRREDLYGRGSAG